MPVSSNARSLEKRINPKSPVLAELPLRCLSVDHFCTVRIAQLQAAGKLRPASLKCFSFFVFQCTLDSTDKWRGGKKLWELWIVLLIFNDRNWKLIMSKSKHPHIARLFVTVSKWPAMTTGLAVDGRYLIWSVSVSSTWLQAFSLSWDFLTAPVLFNKSQTADMSQVSVLCVVEKLIYR